MWSPDDAGRGFDRREVERERGRKGREGLEEVEMEGGRWREERWWWWWRERRGDEIADMVRDWSLEMGEDVCFCRLEFWSRERGRVERMSELSGS